MFRGDRIVSEGPGRRSDGGQESVPGKPGAVTNAIGHIDDRADVSANKRHAARSGQGGRGAPQRATGIPMRGTGNSRTSRRPRLTTSESQILREGMIRERGRRLRSTLHDLPPTTHNPRPRLPASPSPIRPRRTHELSPVTPGRALSCLWANPMPQIRPACHDDRDPSFLRPSPCASRCVFWNRVRVECGLG